jgi:hypothetical protein
MPERFKKLSLTLENCEIAIPHLDKPFSSKPELFAKQYSALFALSDEQVAEIKSKIDIILDNPQLKGLSFEDCKNVITNHEEYGWQLKAHSGENYQPKTVDIYADECDPLSIRHGNLVNAQIVLTGYFLSRANRGVTSYLQGVQKVSDGAKSVAFKPLAEKPKVVEEKPKAVVHAFQLVSGEVDDDSYEDVEY